MKDPRQAMRDELHHLVEIVARKPNGVRALSILIDQATVLSEYKSNRGSIQSRARRPRHRQAEDNAWTDEFFGKQ